MQQITTSVTTMTSREISDLTGKRHPDVKRDIETMMRDLSEDVSKFARIYQDSMNRELTEMLLTGYSAPLRRAVIQRWRELEAAPPAVDLSSAEVLRSMLLGYTEKVIALEAQVAAAAPAVEFVDRYVDATGTAGFRQVCKILRANENTFREFLLEKKIAYRLGRELAPHAQHMDAGRFEVKAGAARSNGHAFNSMRFTAKGINWVAGEFAKHQLAMAHH